MVITLLATLVVLCTTGILMTTDAFWGVEWVDNLHNAASTFALVLVGLHVGGVIVASIEHGENLVLAMIIGWQAIPVTKGSRCPYSLRKRLGNLNTRCAVLGEHAKVYKELRRGK